MLKEQINADLKTAMLARNAFETTVLRGLKASILDEEVKLGKREDGLDNSEIETLVAREVKKRKEAAKQKKQLLKERETLRRQKAKEARDRLKQKEKERKEKEKANRQRQREKKAARNTAQKEKAAARKVRTRK